MDSVGLVRSLLGFHRERTVPASEWGGGAPAPLGAAAVGAAAARVATHTLSQEDCGEIEPPRDVPIDVKCGL